MGERRVTTRGFERMANGVAQIEMGTDATFTFVERHDPGFHAHTTIHDLSQQREITLRDTIGLLFEQLHETGITDDGGLDHLTERTDERALTLALERLNVADHTLWLPKRAYAVFRGFEINCGLAPY